MAVGTPDNTTQVEDRVKADVAREAPDSNPYLRVSFLRSLIAGFSRRIFDFYGDLEAAEERLLPDTTDTEAGARWNTIYNTPQRPASNSAGRAVASGAAGGIIPVGTPLTADGNLFTVTGAGSIADNSINILSITRTGTTATATTASDHNLSSSITVTITGSDQTEYNVIGSSVVVTGLDSFTYQVEGSPVTPATGTASAAYTSAIIDVESDGFGQDQNLDADAPISLQSPIANVSDALNVYFGGVGGGTDAETAEESRDRRLDKIQNPVAHFNEADIIAKAKEVSGVTRVFVDPAGTEIGTIGVVSITRSGNVATVTTSLDHGFEDGNVTSIVGAGEDAYNVRGSRIIVESPTVFHYVVIGVPATPATGSINATTSIALGQVRTLFMRDNDVDPIPTQAEVDTVKTVIDTIRPANTASADNMVVAPTANPTDYVFTELVPSTGTMQDAVLANLAQFHEEETAPGLDIDEKQYEAAIANTIDPATGDKVQGFTLSLPIGDLVNGSGQISTLGNVTF